MSFKPWSTSNPESLEVLRPSFDLRAWGDLTPGDKETIVRYFKNKKWFNTDYGNKTLPTILTLNEKFKANSYGQKTLRHGSPHLHESRGGMGSQRDCCYAPAQEDVFNILMHGEDDVVYEVLSIYAGELDERNFKIFRSLFNDISEQFQLNILMTEDCLIPKQDEKNN